MSFFPQKSNELLGYKYILLFGFSYYTNELLDISFGTECIKGEKKGNISTFKSVVSLNILELPMLWKERNHSKSFLNGVTYILLTRFLLLGRSDYRRPDIKVKSSHLNDTHVCKGPCEFIHLCGTNYLPKVMSV